jgi:hypothetical protein
VADAYAELGEAAYELAEAVEREDQASGLLRSRRAGRAASSLRGRAHGTTGTATS